MQNSKENKKLNRAELKTIMGGTAGQEIEDSCYYIENGQYIHGCPQGQKCRIKKISHDPLIFSYTCMA